MSIEQALRDFLLVVDAVTDVFGQRIYPRVAPQGAIAPYCVMTRISSPGHHHLTGPANFANPRIQFSVRASTPDVAASGAGALRGALDGFRGEMGSERVLWVALADERDTFEHRGDGSQDGLHRTDLDFVVTHRRDP